MVWLVNPTGYQAEVDGVFCSRSRLSSGMSDVSPLALHLIFRDQLLEGNCTSKENIDYGGLILQTAGFELIFDTMT